MRTVTRFDVTRHHIYHRFLVTDSNGRRHACVGIVDTGAPWTEFNDAFLVHTGLMSSRNADVSRKPELETQKYDRTTIPSLSICDQVIDNLEVMVSRFDPVWGIGALIGLDFFRRFRVTIDYEAGLLISEPYHVGVSSEPAT